MLRRLACAGLVQGRLLQGLGSIARSLAVVGVLGLLAAAPGRVWAATCNVELDPTIIQPVPSFVGDTVNISLQIETGSLQDATHMTVDAVRYKLDCMDDGVFPLCTNEGNILTFNAGNESTNCVDAASNPVAVTCALDASDSNIVDCDLVPDAVLPPNNATPCAVSFNTTIASPSIDSTPTVIEGAAIVTGRCDNGLSARAGATTAISVTATATTTTSPTPTTSTTLPANKCAGAKLKAAGKNAACLLGENAQAATRGRPVNGDKVQRCKDKFSAAFAKAEARPPCLTNTDTSDIEQKVDRFVNAVTSALVR